jgi:hypothetical protein
MGLVIDLRFTEPLGLRKLYKSRDLRKNSKNREIYLRTPNRWGFVSF